MIFDLDGTLYLGKKTIPGSIEKIREIKAKGIQTMFFTNTGTRSREGLVEKMNDMGFSISKEEMYCGAYVLAEYIKEKYPKKTIFTISENGLKDELIEAGQEIVSENADIVAVSLDRKFDYEKLSKAYKMISNGAIFLATNNDRTYPFSEGKMPGAGAILSSIEYASGKKAKIIGKPNSFAFKIMQKKGIDKKTTLMIGDRIETDIMFAKNCGIKSALVLSGVSEKKDILEIKPDYIFESVSVIHDV